MVIATGIETNVWNSVVDVLLKTGWTVTYRYDAFDAGIDFDLIVLEKEGEEILFGWDNWLEGEIKCSETRMAEIELQAGRVFAKGEPVNLKPEVIGLYKKNGQQNDV